MTCKELADRLRVALQVWLKGKGMKEGVPGDRYEAITADARLIDHFGETPVPPGLRDLFAPLVKLAGDAVYDPNLEDLVEDLGSEGDLVYGLRGSPAYEFFKSDQYRAGIAALEAAEQLQKG